MRTNSRRYSRNESSVFIAIAHRCGCTCVGSNSSVGDVERGGQRALGVHLAHERALAQAGGQLGQRSRGGGLADPTLAGDEEELAVEQQCQPPNPILRSPSALPSST